MADLISDLAFLGSEELVRRAQHMTRYGEFRELFPKFIQDTFNPEQEEEGIDDERN